MNKKYFLLILVFPSFIFTQLFSQTPNNRFLLIYYDLSTQKTPIATMTQEYKNMQADYFNCSNTWFRLTRESTWVADPLKLQYAFSNPSKAFLDSAYKYNIKIILTTPDNSIQRQKAPCWCFITQYNSDTCQEGLNYWSNHPALWGFEIMDEPYELDDFSLIVPYANHIRTFNPNLLRFVNLPPKLDEMSFPDYGQFVQNYIDSAHPNILSFDCYPIMDDPYTTQDWHNGLFYNMDIMSRKSVENNIPFIYVLSSLKCNPAPGGGCYIDTLSNLVNATSYFMYTGLVYGAKGLAHWNSSWYISNYHFSSDYRNLVRKINKKITEHENILLSLKFKSAYHKNVKSTIGPGNDSIPAHSAWSKFSSDVYANAIFNVSNPFIASPGSTIDSLAVSFLTDDNGDYYFWIFNKSLVSAEEIQLNLKNGGVVEVLDAKTCLPTNAVIHFAPAEAKLFKFIANQTVSGVINTNTTIKGHRVILNVKVQNGAKLTIEACETEFTAGFEIESGSEFEIK